MDNNQKAALAPERGGYTLFVLAVVLTLGIAATGLWYYRNYERRYLQELGYRLNAIADMKVDDLVEYRRERMGDAHMFAENPAFAALVKRALQQTDDAETWRQLQVWLEKVQTHYQYDRVYLLDPQGTERAAAPDRSEPISEAVRATLSEVMTARTPLLRDFYRNEHNDQIYLTLLVPILEQVQQGNVVAVLVLRIDPRRYLYPILTRWPTPSQSAETLLVRREGDTVVFLNQLRFDPDAALSLRRSLNESQLPAVQAVLGHQGLLEGIDYRGKPVFAAVRPVPRAPWFLVARMDKTEVYGPIRERLWGVVALGAALLAGTLGAAGWLWRQRSVQFYRERYLAAEQLWAVSARQEALLSAIPDIVMEVDTAKHYVWANDEGRRFFGNEVIGKAASDYFIGPQETYAAVKPLFNGNDQVFYVESWQRRYDGAKRLLAWWCRVLKDEHGNVVGALSSARDITEQHEAADALRESEEKFREMAEQLVDVLFMTNLDGCIQYVSPSAFAVFGLAPGAMQNHLFTDFIAPADLPRARECFLKEVQQGIPTRELSLEMIRSGGGVFTGEVNSAVLRRHGEIRGTIGIIRDVTDRKRTEMALKKQLVALTQPIEHGMPIELSDLFNLDDLQQIQDAFAAATNVASIITCPDGTPVTRPSHFCRLCKDIIRKTDRGLNNCFHSDAVIGRQNPSGPTVQPCLSGGLWDAGASISVGGRHIANWLIGQVRNEEQNEDRMLDYAREIGADLEDFRTALAEVPVMSRPQFENVAKALFLVANELSLRAYQNIQQARFIQEREQAAQDRERLETQLRQAQKMEAVGQLAGGIAHDFNNLLQVILGNMECVMEDMPCNSPSGEHLRQSQAAAERAVSLTRQLLAFSRRQVIDPQPLDLNAVITEVMKMVQRVIGEHIELSIIPGHRLATVRVDHAQIEQVIMNLCVNARDAMPDGGALTIETENVVFDTAYCESHSWAVPGRYVLLRMTDTGCGMDARTLEQIFDPFFTTKEKGRGTGLGLATVYGIVRQHGGMIQVYSEPQQGSVFKIYLPAVERSAATVERRAPEPVRGGRERILMAEDDPQIRDLAKHILENAGYSVCPASNGDEALRLYREHQGAFDMLLLDVVMPRKGGRAVLDEIRNERPDIRCLFASGYSDNAVHTNFILEAGLHLLQKPYQRDALLRAVRLVLDA